MRPSYRKRQQDGLYPIIESLRAVREQRGIPRKVLAHQIGYDVNTLVKWERGTILPSLQALHDWCQGLGVELILDDEPADPMARRRPVTYRPAHHGR